MSDAGAAAQKPLIAVTGSDKPYIYDLPHMLSLPPGFEFRFRYRPAWVERVLGTEIAANPGALRGRTVIVVFHSASQRRLIPVRRCRVVSLEAVGAIIYLRFRVEEFMRVPRDDLMAGPAPAASALDDLQKVAASLFGEDLGGKDLAERLGDGFYLRVAKGDDPWPRGSWLKRLACPRQYRTAPAEEWAVLAQLLGTESILWDVPMFYLLGFQRQDGGYARAGRLLRRSANVKVEWWQLCPLMHANKLVEGERYRLRLLEWCTPRDDTHPPVVNVTCKFDDRMMQLESAASLVVGKYDIIEFSILAKQPGFGYLEVRADPDGNVPTPPDWPRLYAARVPVDVRMSAVRGAVVLAFGVAGLVAYQRSKNISAATNVPEAVCQLIGTILIFVVLGEVVDRFLRFSKGLREYTQPPTTPGAKP